MFQLNKIGIKINKPQNYYLMIYENVREINNKLGSIFDA